MVPGQQAVAGNGVLAHADQAAGLANAAALGDVGEDGDDLFLWQVGVEERSALALGKAGLAGLAIEQAALLGAVVAADGEVAVAAFAVVWTIWMLAAEECEVIHNKGRLRGVQGVVGSVQLL